MGGPQPGAGKDARQPEGGRAAWRVAVGQEVGPGVLPVGHRPESRLLVLRVRRPEGPWVRPRFSSSGSTWMRSFHRAWGCLPSLSLSFLLERHGHTCPTVAMAHGLSGRSSRRTCHLAAIPRRSGCILPVASGGLNMQLGVTRVRLKWPFPGDTCFARPLGSPTCSGIICLFGSFSFEVSGPVCLHALTNSEGASARPAVRVSLGI